MIPLAEGEKDQRIREADGYRLKRIDNEAEGDVARFDEARDRVLVGEDADHIGSPLDLTVERRVRTCV